MWNFFKKKKVAPEKNFEWVATKQLKNNEKVIQSLRDYDAGKKEISTVEVRRHLQGLRSAS